MEKKGMEPLKNAIQELAEEQSDRDFILISRGVTRELHHDLSEHLATKKRHTKCTVFLTTRGGDADGGYRTARCLRHNYEHVRLIIPSLCKSAGTLIAIGADELVIGDLGELGPLDVQVRKANELAERSSGLDIIQALGISLSHVQGAFRDTLLGVRRGLRLSTRLAGEFASQLAAGVAAPLYAQIDPNRLGEMQRAVQIASQYGERLNACSNALQEDALEKLVAGYPSHGFVIDRKEAKELFNSVTKPTEKESKLTSVAWEILRDEAEIGPLFLLDCLTQEESPNGKVADSSDAGFDPEDATEQAGAAAADPGTAADEVGGRAGSNDLQPPDVGAAETQGRV
ncbi:SDH family Clp fold serine proteinase [Achromobacter xylosoxidans]